MTHREGLSAPPPPVVYDDARLNVGSPPLAADAPLLTPTGSFFRRNHAPPPVIDPVTWQLRIDGLVRAAASLSLADLTAMPSHTVESTLVCAGLRRAELQAVGPLNGELPWGADAVSTGRWQGVRLRDVLATIGILPSATHVAFEGLDDVERHGRRFGFGASLPLARALQEDVLLAMHLNDAPIPTAHGFPLRVIVPGVIGARSVKWLGRMELRDRPSENYFQVEAYRIAREPSPDDPRDVRHGVVLDDIPRNAVITAPAEGAALAAGDVRVHGWAIGEGGAAVEAVELSIDAGRTWVNAMRRPDARRWTWTLWEHTLTLAPGRHTIVARARDAAGTMPETLEAVRNVKAYGNNAWHRVSVLVT